MGAVLKNKACGYFETTRRSGKAEREERMSVTTYRERKELIKLLLKLARLLLILNPSQYIIAAGRNRARFQHLSIQSDVTPQRSTLKSCHADPVGNDVSSVAVVESALIHLH